jgi:hypothetical protein
MNRGVITISESGTVSMPTDTVWMTMQEIADMYNVFGCYVRKAVKAIFKDGILKEQGVRRHVRKSVCCTTSLKEEYFLEQLALNY